MRNCPKCGCEIDGTADCCPGCLASVQSLLSAIEGDYSGMTKSDLVLTCQMLANGRAAWRKEFEQLAQRVSGPGCLLAGPGRGDCEHFIGLPGLVIKGQHDDDYGKPNGWCWHCWWSYRTHRAEQALRQP